jgi:hypothetical protein
MPPLDGHYRHHGSRISWDDTGVDLTHLGGRRAVSARWDQIDGVRLVGVRAGYVQLLVRGHVTPPNPWEDPFAIAVNSDPDANRLLTVLGWRAGSERTGWSNRAPRGGTVTRG